MNAALADKLRLGGVREFVVRGGGFEFFQRTDPRSSFASVICESYFSFFVTMGIGSSNARVADVRKSDATRLIVGPGEPVVRSIKVVRGEQENVLTPDTKLGPGDRYVIVVTADGKVEAAVE